MTIEAQLPTPGQAPAGAATHKHFFAKIAWEIALALLMALLAAPVPEWLRAAPLPAPAPACEAQIHALVVAPLARPRCLVARVVSPA